MVADPGKSRGDQLALREQFLAAANERIKRGPGGGGRRCTGFKRRYFDRGQADLAAVVEHETAAVDDVFGNAARDYVAATNRRAIRLLLRYRAGTSAKSCKLDRQRSGQKDPSTPSHHRLAANGRNTAVLRRAWMPAAYAISARRSRSRSSAG